MRRNKTVVCEGKTEVSPISKQAASRATPDFELGGGKASLKYRVEKHNVTTWRFVKRLVFFSGWLRKQTHES